MTDLAAIRARHAEYDRVPRATGFNSSVDQAHADRGALLAALDALADSQAELDRLARALDEANNRVAHVESDLFESRQALDRLTAALETAKRTIRTWSEMGAREFPEVLDELWALYQNSPEMREINAALAEAG